MTCVNANVCSKARRRAASVARLKAYAPAQQLLHLGVGPSVWVMPACGSVRGLRCWQSRDRPSPPHGLAAGTGAQS
eukprot:362745-Chlamydomonas_euryale.AAC.6